MTQWQPASKPTSHPQKAKLPLTLDCLSQFKAPLADLALYLLKRPS